MKQAKELFLKHEQKIVLLVGFLLVGAIAFEAGYLKGQGGKIDPIVIEKPSESPKIALKAPENAKSSNNSGGQILGENSSEIDQNKKNCAFVGSKNSNKYHTPACQWAKRIKPENVTCFSSEDETKSKGYLPDKNCIK